MSTPKQPAPNSLRPQTIAVRAGQPASSLREHAEALMLTSSFRFDSAEHAAQLFSEDGSGDVYSRYSNPTVRLFETRMAQLEGTERAIATASGMAAIFACIVSLCAAGSKVVAARQLFGATLGLLENIVRKFAVEVVIVDSADPQEWAQAAGGKADLFFCESPSNPQLQLFDIAALAEVAHAAGALLVVDNCVCTPILQQPAALGADLVMHSGTKYIDGQGRVLGGVICGPAELIEGRILPYLRSGGPTLSAFNAWILAKGIETLPLRVKEISRVAAELAEFVATQTGVEYIRYPWHPSHPDYALAQRQQKAGGGLVTIYVAGGQPAAFRFINALQVFSLTANFGDVKSIATHPATTTHSRLSEEVRTRIGITPGLVRLSIGLDDPADLQADITRGLAAI